MIVQALIQREPSNSRRGMPEHLQALTVAMFRQRRDRRHQRIQRFLANPQALDAVLPGLSTLPPGSGNDRLRSLRYSDDRRYGQSKLAIDPDELRAAMVAQRIRCWRALRPTEAFAVRTCRIGQKAACCRFLGRDEGGWLCAKNTPLAEYLTTRAAAGEMTARSDNCSGRSAR